MSQSRKSDAANEPAPPVREGDVLGGKYRVESLLGTGGNGFVYAARHVALGQRVAVKLLPATAQRDPELAARFLREAQTAARIQSPHVARVLDVGTLDNGASYIVFEHLDGMDLADWLAAHGPLPIDDVVRHALEICEALAEAHALGIVHRDIKPENIFLANSQDGGTCVKLIDFGISKITQPSWVGTELSLTRSQILMGSPKYMAPEQLRAARDADERSDIWSLGVVMYELLAGRGPFRAETLADLCAAVLKEEPLPVVELRADVPPGLSAAIARCLRKAPAERFANVGELARALAPFGDDVAAVSSARVDRLLQRRGSAPTLRRWSGDVARVSSIPPVVNTLPRGSVPEITVSGAPSSRRRGRFARGSHARRVLVTFVAGAALALVAIAAAVLPKPERPLALESGFGVASGRIADGARRVTSALEAEERAARPAPVPDAPAPPPPRPQKVRPAPPRRASPADPGYKVPLYGRD